MSRTGKLILDLLIDKRTTMTTEEWLDNVVFHVNDLTKADLVTLLERECEAHEGVDTDEDFS